MLEFKKKFPISHFFVDLPCLVLSGLILSGLVLFYLVSHRLLAKYADAETVRHVSVSLSRIGECVVDKL